MTKTEIAIDCVNRFSSASRVIKISFVLTNLAFLLVIVGFATTGWVYITRSGQNTSDKQGLFNQCSVSGIFTCCQSLNSYLSDNNVESVPAWFEFTRAIVGMGVTTSFIATVMLYIHSFGDFNSLRRPYSIISYISGIFLLLGALVYGVMFGKDSWQTGATLHGSYGVTTFAGVLFIVAGFVTHCLDKPNQVLAIAQTNGRQSEAVRNPRQIQTPIGSNQQGNGQPRRAAPSILSTLRTNGRQSDVVVNPRQTPIGSNQQGNGQPRRAVPSAPLSLQKYLTNGRQSDVVVNPRQTPIGSNQQGNGQPRRAVPSAQLSLQISLVDFEKRTNGRQSDVVVNPRQTPIGSNQQGNGQPRKAVPSAPSPLQECVVCFEREVNTVFVPCGHSSCCKVCAEKCSKKCPNCRGHIEQVIRVYK